MRTDLICHHDDRSTREGLARWLASCSDLVGIVELQNRVVHQNPDAIADTIASSHHGEAYTIDTTGRRTRSWGEPWLTRCQRCKVRARAPVKAQFRSTAAR